MPQEIEKDLREIEQLLYNVQSTYGDIARNAAQARFAYEMAKARAVYDIDHRVIAAGEKKPTLPVQDAEATLMIEKEKEAARLAEVELDIAQKTIANIQSRLSSTQTRSKLVQIEADLAR